MRKDIDTFENMRDVYVAAVLDMAAEDDRIVVMDADLKSCVNSGSFEERFHDRFFNMGISEANMIGSAAGLSSMGFLPYVHTFASFASRRVFDQWFLSANYAKQNVKLFGTDPGITSQLNGGTHMPFGDISLHRTVPGLTVMEPSDSWSCYQLTRATRDIDGCTYMRLQRKGTANLYKSDQEVIPGKGIVIREGEDLALIAMGMVMVQEAMKAADLLEKDGIKATVVDMHTVKPLDDELVLDLAKRTGALVTCENAQSHNGLGSAVADLVTSHRPVPVIRHGVQDEFGEVGKMDYLIERYRLSAPHIVESCRKALELKKKDTIHS